MWSEKRKQASIRLFVYRLSLVSVLIAFGLAIMLTSCRSTRPDDDVANGVTVNVSIEPMVLKADTTETAVVWIEVKQNQVPVPDSTFVSLVTNLGSISETTLTEGGGGLATAIYKSTDEPGVGRIIAHSLGVKDTIAVILN